MRILGICGSLQARSGNLVLLQTAVASAPQGVEVVLFDGIRHLPPFNPDLEEAGTPPPSIEEWRRALGESDALLVAAPEYGFSLPGALKNGIDWVIGSGELERKVVGLTAAVRHPERGQRSLRALGDTLFAVSARVVGGQPIVRGPTFEREVAALLDAIIKEAQESGQPPKHGLGWTIRPKALLAEWVNALNRGDADALASFYAPAVRAPVEQMASDCIVENIFEDGEWAILEWRDTGERRGCEFFHVRKGQIVSQHGYGEVLLGGPAGAGTDTNP